MTDQEINMAIAEACGWKRSHEKDICGNFEHRFWNPPVIVSQTVSGRLGRVREQHLPEFCNDLNAMAEAEKTLRRQPDAFQTGGFSLYIALLRRSNAETPECANASQRAEAFLRTIGKWKD